LCKVKKGKTTSEQEPKWLFETNATAIVAAQECYSFSCSNKEGCCATESQTGKSYNEHKLFQIIPSLQKGTC